jgi:hypothetical protein
MRNFKDSIAGKDHDEDDEDDERPELTKAQAQAKAKTDDRPAEERQVNEALGRSGD